MCATFLLIFIKYNIFSSLSQNKMTETVPVTCFHLIWNVVISKSSACRMNNSIDSIGVVKEWRKGNGGWYEGVVVKESDKNARDLSCLLAFKCCNHIST
jgi:hypothetical protein